MRTASTPATALALFGLIACGSASEARELGTPVPPAGAPRSLVEACPEARMVGRDASGLAGLRIRNDLGEPVAVFLDRCVGYVRVADLAGAGETEAEAPADFPADLVVYPDGYRFHVYAVAEGRRLGRVTLDPARSGADQILVLAREAMAWPVAERQESGVDYSRFQAVTSSRSETRPSVSVFSTNTLGVLTFGCSVAGPFLVLSTGGEIRTDSATAHLFTGERVVAREARVPVVRSIRDGVILPSSWIPLLRERFQVVTAFIAIAVDEDELVTVRHLFHPGGVPERLAALVCQ